VVSWTGENARYTLTARRQVKQLPNMLLTENSGITAKGPTKGAALAFGAKWVDQLSRLSEIRAYDICPVFDLWADRKTHGGARWQNPQGLGQAASGFQVSMFRGFPQARRK